SLPQTFALPRAPEQPPSSSSLPPFRPAMPLGAVPPPDASSPPPVSSAPLPSSPPAQATPPVSSPPRIVTEGRRHGLWLRKTCCKCYMVVRMRLCRKKTCAHRELKKQNLNSA